MKISYMEFDIQHVGDNELADALGMHVCLPFQRGSMSLFPSTKIHHLTNFNTVNMIHNEQLLKCFWNNWCHAQYTIIQSYLSFLM